MFCRLLLLDLRGDDPLGPVGEEVEPGLRGTGGPAVDDRRTTRLGRRLQRWNVRVLSSITLAWKSGSVTVGSPVSMVNAVAIGCKNAHLMLKDK